MVLGSVGDWLPQVIGALVSLGVVGYIGNLIGARGERRRSQCKAVRNRCAEITAVLDASVALALEYFRVGRRLDDEACAKREAVLLRDVTRLKGEVTALWRDCGEIARPRPRSAQDLSGLALQFKDAVTASPFGGQFDALEADSDVISRINAAYEALRGALTDVARSVGRGEMA